MRRCPEPELMDLVCEAAAYADANFADVNDSFVDALVLQAGDGPIRALELGTGPADIPIRLARRVLGWQITATDSAQAMLSLAHRAVRATGMGDRIELVQADAKDLPMPDASYDVVFSNSILHHVADPVAFWAESLRVLRPGGLLFLRDLFRPADEAFARLLVEQHAGAESELLKEEFYRSLLAAYTPDEIRQQLQGLPLSQALVRCVSDRHVDVIARR